MTIEVKMPRLSDTMEEGVLLRWLKQPGDSVHKGDAIAEVETDKATMEVEAFEEGALSEILVHEGESVPVGLPIARLVQPGARETVERSEGTLPEQENSVSDEIRREPVSKFQGKQSQQETSCRLGHLNDSIEGEAAGVVLTPSERRKRRQEEAEKPSPSARRKPMKQERIKASPRARKLADAQDIDLTTLQGSGPESRIVEADVREAISAGKIADSPQRGVSTESRDLSRMRKTIARRMTQSKRQAPHFYVTMSIRSDQLVRLRNELKRDFDVSYNDFIIKACAMSLRRHPRLNATCQDDCLAMNEAINISQAVAVPDGLLAPVLHDADQLSLEEISEQSASLIARTQGNHLKESDLSGGTFTISNMGMMGVEDFIAIINPPQVAILAVGAIQEVPVVENGVVIPGYLIKLTLSADHRVLNGAEAAEFLKSVRYFLENPVLLTETSLQYDLSLHGQNTGGQCRHSPD